MHIFSFPRYRPYRHTKQWKGVALTDTTTQIRIIPIHQQETAEKKGEKQLLIIGFKEIPQDLFIALPQHLFDWLCSQ